MGERWREERDREGEVGRQRQWESVGEKRERQRGRREGDRDKVDTDKNEVDAEGRKRERHSNEVTKGEKKDRKRDREGLGQKGRRE